MSIPVMLPKIRDPYKIGQEVFILSGKSKLCRGYIDGYNKRGLIYVKLVEPSNRILITRRRVAWPGMRVQDRAGLTGTVRYIESWGEGHILKVEIDCADGSWLLQTTMENLTVI